MKGKFTAVLFILIFILIAAVVFTVLSGLDRSRASEPSPTPASIAGDTVNITGTSGDAKIKSISLVEHTHKNGGAGKPQ